MVKTKKHDLEERTYIFSKKIMSYAGQLSENISNNEIGRQLIRSAGSVGANYIEANESLGKRDFIMRIKISKKESKESRYWLRLSEPKVSFLNEREGLMNEATELMKIFGAILEKSK